MMSDIQKQFDASFADRAATIRNREHIPAVLVDMLEAVTELQAEAARNVSIALPDPSTLPNEEQNLMGKPLLPRDEFPHDAANAAELFRKLLPVLCRDESPMAEAAGVLEKALDKGELDLEEAFCAFHRDDEEYFMKWAERTGDAPRALPFLVKAALEPSLRAVAEGLSKHTGTRNSARMHGTCPICGSMPLISRLNGKEGFRFATCSHCLHEYRVRRIACLLCDEDAHDKLSFFTAKEEPGYRVEVCKTCGNYSKTIDFREMDRKSLPVLDDLDSMTLDFVARENGYQRPTLSAWGF
jgi:FdhE protein